MAQLAQALAAAGDSVEVHVPGPWSPPPATGGLPVHVLPDRFGPRSVAVLREAQRRAPAVMLLQHSPFNYGARGMNLLFPHLLRTIPGPLAVMFHEVAFPREPGQPLRHALLAQAQRQMARALLARASAACVSTTAWNPTLASLGWSGPITLLPIPSNLLPPPALPSRAVLRAGLSLADGDVVVGHFGTYGAPVAGPLAATLPALLAGAPSRRALLLGRGAGRFREQLLRAHPGLEAQLCIPGNEEAAQVSRALVACDVLLQPFEDGVTTRRTSFMAALAHGRPVCTNRGPLTEAGWESLAGVHLAPNARGESLRETTETLLARGREAWDESGRQAAGTYAQHFSLDQCVPALRELAVRLEAA